MKKKREVCSIQELEGLGSCMLNAVYHDDVLHLEFWGDEGMIVAYFRLVDGVWHFHGKKCITLEQFGELAALTDGSDIHSVHFNSTLPLIKIVIKAIGTRATDRVIMMLRRIFPTLEVSERKWSFKGESHPMYYCRDHSYYLDITVAVMPEAH